MDDLKDILIVVGIIALVWILLAWLTTSFVATIVAIVVGILLLSGGRTRFRRSGGNP
jgi:Flp pilus assembly protein TadB